MRTTQPHTTEVYQGISSHVMNNFGTTAVLPYDRRTVNTKRLGSTWNTPRKTKNPGISNHQYYNQERITDVTYKSSSRNDVTQVGGLSYPWKPWNMVLFDTTLARKVRILSTLILNTNGTYISGLSGIHFIMCTP